MKNSSQLAAVVVDVSMVNISDELDIEKIKKNPNYEYLLEPRVEIYFKIEGREYSSFWKSKNGQALDCFSEKIYGAKLSKKLSLTDSQIENREDSFESINFYDGVESDGTVYSEGVIGNQDNHLDGYLSYFKDYDNFAISMTWALDNICFERAYSAIKYTPAKCKNP